ncbi:GNAT family N-acetyltransferase [Mycobacterium paraseoulense]|uniref:GNAT family N-acetyltransferase n=1 Tax=Mycobacterium paraseoulense TaxID=590652 RepID=A0A1X0I877_9MYCO|nr:GNAT family N-acetyltransferase [Mycobacterium paraseoulense]MCV7397046.1 GNAT family N-acetyltransferase [Mycobacterium paraseoulense]ORB38744.1 GNAT family N-acetyltransferase [Mycobacterium paraseoulense]BBZ69641.1 N-acetyltransferase [Mycobacterium paraseoulense]
MTEVRAAVPADAHEVARLHARSWRVAYRGLIAREYLDSLTPQVLAARYTFGRVGLRMPATLVAVDGSAIRGFATTGLSRERDLPNFGELMALYVDPAYVSTGVGRLLMSTARERLRLVGVTGAVLWVLDANTRARRFYERDGWWADGGCRTEVYGNDTLRLVRYRLQPL